MTVIDSDNEHVTASADIPQDIVAKPFIRNISDNVVFPAAAFDNWYFDDISKIGKKNTRVQFSQCQYPEALKADYSALHPFYKDKVKIEVPTSETRTTPTEAAKDKNTDKPGEAFPANQAEADAKINGIFPIHPLEAEEEKASSPTDG
jgi:hypothetical protein